MSNKQETYIIQDDPQLVESFYVRDSCVEKIQLENTIIGYYETDNEKLYCQIVNSGMAAITTSIESILMSHPNELINIIYCDEIYCDTPDIFCTIQRMHPNQNITVNPVNIMDSMTITNLISQFEDEINILFIESCTNPNGYMMDFEIVPDLRSKCKKLYFIVDNTFASHVIFNPFVVDADIVVSSLTKYYSAGTNIAGMIITNSQHLNDNFIEWQKFIGAHVSPIICENILSKISNISNRMYQSYVSTIAVVDAIKAYPIVKDIHYLYDSSHQSNNLTKKYFNI